MAQAQQPAVTSSPAAFSAAGAPDGALRSVFITLGGPVAALFTSPIGNNASTPFTGTQLSRTQQALLGKLATDSNGGYHAAWDESTSGQSFTVQYRYSKDAGQTWTPAQQIYSGSADNPASIGFLLAADSAGAVRVAWDGDNAIHYRCWSAAGGWGEPVQLSGDVRSSAIELAVTKDELARAAWNIAATNPSLTMRIQSADRTWGAPHTVTPTRAYDLALAVDEKGKSHVVWRANDGLRSLTIP